MNIKEAFIKKLHKEFLSYRESLEYNMHGGTFEDSRKAEIFRILYEAIINRIDMISDAVMLSLLEQGVDVLETLYEKWTDDGDKEYRKGSRRAADDRFTEYPQTDWMEEVLRER